MDNLKAEAATAGQLPELPYSLRTRKLSIAITCGIIWFFSCALIQILYFSLRYAGGVKPVIGIFLLVASL
jgi:hypothetical protein